MDKAEKIAVILMNLGGPDRAESIAPFLKNFFMDPLILRVPLPVRFFLSRLIAFKRTRKEAGESYAALGGGSPLLANTQAQADALQQTLQHDDPHSEYRSFVCMRYWHPLSEDVARAVQCWAPDRIVLLPLYPQYSTTTTESSFRAWDAACEKIGLAVPTARLCCYPFEQGFISQSAQHVRAAYDAMAQKAAAENLPAPRILFSAHGLPQKVVDDGDPYQWQCIESARAIVTATGLTDADWAICYQSRVGPLQWIGPSTDAEIHRAGADGVPLVVYPHAFVSEHVETLVEIEEEYRELAEECGVPAFARVGTVAAGDAFIAGLAGLVRNVSTRTGTFTHDGPRICPHHFGACRFNFEAAGKKSSKYGVAPRSAPEEKQAA